MRQRLPGQKYLIGWRLLFNTEPSVEMLIERIAHLSRSMALRYVANFDAAVFQANLQQRNEDHIILGAFGKGLPINRALQLALIANPGSKIFHELQLRTLATLSHAYAEAEVDSYNETQILFECCLLINSLLIDSQESSGIELSRAAEIRAMLHDNVTATLPQERTIAYLIWLHKRAAEVGFDILARWRDARDISLSDHYIVTWELLKPFVEHNIDAPETSALCVPEAIPDRDISRLVARWIKSHSLSNPLPSTAVPLHYTDDVQSRREPFAEVRPGVFVCVSRQSLAQLLGDLLFFDAADCLSAEASALRESFFVRHGEFLNEFVRSIAERAAGEGDTIEGDFYIRGRGKATDLVWQQDETIYLFEVVAKRFNFEHSVHALDADWIDRDFEKMLVKKVDQLQWNVEALLNGQYGNRVPRFRAGRTAIQPVIVTMSFSPRLSTLRDELALASSSKLETMGALPLEVLTIADFQVLDGFAHIGITLNDLFEKKRALALPQLISFRDFMVTNLPDEYRAAYKVSVKRLDRIVQDLINIPGQAPAVGRFSGSIKNARRVER